MAFNPKKQVFAASVKSVAIGKGEKSVTVGGERAYPFYSFDAPTENRPRIALEISDKGIEVMQTAGMRSFFEGCVSAADIARKASSLEGVSLICLSFDSADPNGEDRSAQACAELAKEVAAATDLPLMLAGCKNIEKDTEIFRLCAEALKDENIVLLSAREENYKEVGALADPEGGLVVGAESSMDINLAKQLNVLLTQQGVSRQSMLMNLGSSCVGYGFEYLASTMDRVRAAALEQNDVQLQIPVVAPVSSETWIVKESMASEEEMPEWGDVDERGVEMEIATAAACLTGGADIVIMKHPAAIAAVARFINSLL